MKCLTGSKLFFPLSDQLHVSQWATQEVGSWRLSLTPKHKPRGLVQRAAYCHASLCSRGGQGWHPPRVGLRGPVLTGCGVQWDETALLSWTAGQNAGLTTWERLRTGQAGQAESHPWEFGVEAEMGPIQGTKVHGTDKHLVFDTSLHLDLCILLSCFTFDHCYKMWAF